MRRGTNIRSVSALAAAFTIFLLLPMSPAAAVAGAAFTGTNPAVDGPGTCFNGPGVVNCNIYEEKDDVWINAGPNEVGPSALTDGFYFFVVIEPGGESVGSDFSINDGTATGEAPKNLSDTNDVVDDAGDAYTDRIFHVSDGDIDSNLGTHDQYSSTTQGLMIRLFPYDTTSNPGGEYTVELCFLGTEEDESDWVYPVVNDSVCKSDNFKVREGNVVEFGVLSGLKYYDANTNGQWDAGEPGLEGWPIDFTDGTANTVFTDSNGEFTVNLSPDVYTFEEEQASSPWVQTGNTVDQTSSTGGNSASLSSFVYTVTVTDTGQTTGLNFGNVCLGAGGGHTLGFWSNNNGKAAMNDGGTLAPELALLAGLNLRNANGSNFDPTTYAQFRTWLLNATATNMAYMLSAQLAAMELNVEAGFVSGSALVWDGSGFVTINALMAAANTELGLHGLTLFGSPFRAYQETLKIALDAANNNLNFVQPTPGTCPNPDFT